MVRFKELPRSRQPSLGELLGISQRERQVSGKFQLRITNTDHRARRKRNRFSRLGWMLRRMFTWMESR
jgi:hypothetical protein